MEEQLSFEFEQRKPIKGYPELHWTGKRPYTATQYYPAQLKESYGESKDGWMNKIFWGDNLQVMSHLLKEYRGKVDLIYIDPPFDSKADYKKKIKMKTTTIENNMNSFEEKQYTDIWTNDAYLQFLYERFILMRELLSETGSIFVECDPTRGHYIKILLDEVFGQDNFVNQIIWKRTFSHSDSGQGAKHLGRLHDMILYYKKTDKMKINTVYTPYSEKYINDFYKYQDEDGRKYRFVSLLGPGGASKGNPFYEFLGVSRYWVHSKEKMQQLYEAGIVVQTKPGAVPQKKRYLDEAPGVPLQDIWVDISAVQGGALENYNYPTQKPEELLERIILTATDENDLVFDCFMGSGTTQAVALKNRRRFIGADINLGAVQTATKRIINILEEAKESDRVGFEVYNVNNYDFFRNPVEAKAILMDALDIQKFDASTIYDGELDGYMVKIMPTNRIATKADLEELKANLPYATFEKRKEEDPTAVVERIKIVCMGHEADLKASLEQDLSAYKLDIEIVDILRDKSNLQFKREADAIVIREDGKLKIKEFYPMNLLQKLSMQRESVDEWRQLVESVFIDWNYDGEILKPSVTDIPGKDEYVKGEYNIPEGAGRIKIKITDLLSESLEVEV